MNNGKILRITLRNLLAQVLQAREGFDHYNDSPSMDIAIEESLRVLDKTDPVVIFRSKCLACYLEEPKLREELYFHSDGGMCQATSLRSEYNEG